MRLIDADVAEKIIRDYADEVGCNRGEYELANGILKAVCKLEDVPTVEAVPKSYAEQIRWERDVAVGQLNEIGCQFGQRMDEVKDKLNSAKNWIPCSERLPGEYDYPEQRYRVLVSCSDGIIRNATIKSMLSGENHFCSGYEFVYEAWMPLPEAYKGETENDES